MEFTMIIWWSTWYLKFLNYHRTSHIQKYNLMEILNTWNADETSLWRETGRFQILLKCGVIINIEVFEGSIKQHGNHTIIVLKISYSHWKWDRENKNAMCGFLLKGKLRQGGWTILVSAVAKDVFPLLHWGSVLWMSPYPEAESGGLQEYMWFCFGHYLQITLEIPVFFNEPLGW